MPELPAPPDEWSDERQQAWYAGAATVGRILATQGSVIAREYREAAGDLDDEATEAPVAAEGDAREAVATAAANTDQPSATGDATSDGDDDHPECPDCGTAVIEGFGGGYCPECETTVSPV